MASITSPNPNVFTTTLSEALNLPISPYPDRFVRRISSQLKHSRRPTPGMPRSRRFRGIACSRIHLSVVWNTSLSADHVGGISGEISG